MSKTEQAKLSWKERLGKLEIKKNESWEKVISRLDSIILKIGIILIIGILLLQKVFFFQR